MSWIHDAIIGLVEGLTEFLPISSTGHLIITRALLDLEEQIGFRQMIVVQGAAILAVCFEYRAKLWHTARTLHADPGSRGFALNLFLAFLPAALAGLAFEDTIRSVLFAPIPVAMALVIGGVLILWAEKRPHEERVRSVDEIRPLDALRIGLFQMLALVPGTSRSAATILGGLFTGLDRRTAAEFSFFVAIPVMFAATGYKLCRGLRVRLDRDPVPAALRQPALVRRVRLVSDRLGRLHSAQLAAGLGQLVELPSLRSVATNTG